MNHITLLSVLPALLVRSGCLPEQEPTDDETRTDDGTTAAPQAADGPAGEPLACGTMEPPADPASLRDCLHAEPAWAGDPRADVPQVPDRFQLFHSLPSMEAARVDGALVICSVRVASERRWDAFRAPDLAVTLRLGDAPPVTVWGPENEHTALLSVPGVDLERGDRLSARVADRDVFGSTTIGEPRGRYEGRFPFTLLSDEVAVECRAADRDEVERRLAPALRSADEALGETERRLRPDPRAPDMGYPTAHAAAASAAVLGAAGYVGWADPRIRERLDRMGGFAATWAGRARARTDALVRELPPPSSFAPIEGTDLRARVASASCEPRDVGAVRDRTQAAARFEPRCVVRLELEAQRGTTLSPAAAGYDLHAAVVRPESGRSLDAHLVGYERAGVPVAPAAAVTLARGERVTAVLALPELVRFGDGDPARRTRLLQLSTAGRTTPLRID